MGCFMGGAIIGARTGESNGVGVTGGEATRVAVLFSRVVKLTSLIPLVLFCGSAFAQQGYQPLPDPVFVKRIDFTEQTLTNGLHVIYAPRGGSGVVHVRV